MMCFKFKKCKKDKLEKLIKLEPSIRIYLHNRRYRRYILENVDELYKIAKELK